MPTFNRGDRVRVSQWCLIHEVRGMIVTVDRVYENSLDAHADATVRMQNGRMLQSFTLLQDGLEMANEAAS